MVNEIQKKFKKDPLQAVITTLSIAGVCISLLNFYVLSTIQPLVSRLDAVEEKLDVNSIYSERFIITEKTASDNRERLARIEEKIDRIIEKL